MIIKTIEFFRNIRNFTLRIIGNNCPKNKKLVLFGALNGQYYGDNAKYLFEWVVANNKEIRAVWITRNKEVLHQLRAANLPVAMANSWRGYWLLCQANVAVFTNRLHDFSQHADSVPNNIKLLALRHGRSVKRIRFASVKQKLNDREKNERLKEKRLIKYAISTSEFISDIQEECLKIGREKHIVTGYPRNDYLSMATVTPNTAIAPLFDTNRKVILYGPSWRHGRSPTQFFPFKDFNEKQLVTFLRDHKYLLLLRPHFNDLKKYSSIRQFLQQLAQYRDCIRLATHDQVADVNTLLPYIDLLISDYSALYHDYLLLDRPIIFIPYDYEEFNLQNGFLYDYFANLPGPAITTFNQLIQYLITISNGEDPHRIERSNLRDKIHAYQDNKSCFRVTETLKKIVNS